MSNILNLSSNIGNILDVVLDCINCDVVANKTIVNFMKNHVSFVLKNIRITEATSNLVKHDFNLKMMMYDHHELSRKFCF